MERPTWIDEWYETERYDSSHHDAVEGIALELADMFTAEFVEVARFVTWLALNPTTFGRPRCPSARSFYYKAGEWAHTATARCERAQGHQGLHWGKLPAPAGERIWSTEDTRRDAKRGSLPGLEV